MNDERSLYLNVVSLCHANHGSKNVKPCSTLDHCLMQYMSDIGQLLDRHVPLRRKERCALRGNNEWFKYNYTMLTTEKRLRRRLARKWLISKSELDREIYLKQHRKYNTLLKTSKRDFYRNKISENTGNEKELYMIITKLVYLVINFPLTTVSMNSPRNFALIIVIRSGRYAKSYVTAVMITSKMLLLQITPKMLVISFFHFPPLQMTPKSENLLHLHPINPARMTYYLHGFLRNVQNCYL